MLHESATPMPERAGTLTVKQAAEYVGLSTATLNMARVKGSGPAFLKLGQRVVYLKADLDSWLASCRRTSTSAAA